MKVLLTHTPEFRRQYYGERALRGLQTLAEVRLDDADDARMQSHAFFINLSRGNLVDEAALAAALRDNRIAGAAMDVGRARDQMPTPELAKLPNVIATPHVGGLTPQAIEHQALETVSQVEAIIKGEVPFGAVNAAHWRRRPAKAVP